MDLLGKETGSQLSVIKDPFNPESITDVDIHGQYAWGNKKFYWYARVKFMNGNTAGEQRTPDCSTFEEVVAAIKQIINSIK